MEDHCQSLPRKNHNNFNFSNEMWEYPYNIIKGTLAFKQQEKFNKVELPFSWVAVRPIAN